MKRNNQYPLPNEWNWIPLGECAQLINGRAYAQHELLDQGTPVLRIQNLNGGDRWYYSNIDLPPEKYCQPGDLLFAWSATFGPYRWTGPKSIYHYHIWKVLPKPNLDQAFAFRLLQQITQQVKSAAHGVTMVHMTKGGMEEWKVPLPPIAEQKRIAAILDKAEELRSLRRQALRELDAIAQSIFLEMFADPVTNSKQLPVHPVGDLTDCIVPGRDKPKSFSGKIPWITTDDLIYLGVTTESPKGLGLTLEEIKQVRARVIPRGSVILSCVGELGITSIAGTDVVINQQLHSFQCGRDINNVFLNYCLSFQKTYMCLQASSTTVLYMNKTVCNSIPVILPPLSLQQEFARRVEAIEQLKTTHRESLTYLDALFASLQHRAFRGEL